MDLGGFTTSKGYLSGDLLRSCVHRCPICLGCCCVSGVNTLIIECWASISLKRCMFNNDGSDAVKDLLKLAVWLLRRGIVSLKLYAIKEAKIRKCTESMWKLTYYASVQVFIFTIMYDEPWFGDRKELFKGWPNQFLKYPLKLFYMCQCGFYIYSIGALLIWETRRKDFSIMMSHHVITVFLISYSYFTRFFRCGSIVLALHDTSDVFMEAAKLFKYCGKETAASMSFGLFAISWLFLRLIYFPFWIIRSSSYDLIKYLDLLNPYHIWMYYVFNTMLLTLLIFHLYWWILICSMVLRQLKNKGKVGDDIRSDSEDGE